MEPEEVEPLPESVKAYVAGQVDLLGRIRSRWVGETELPSVAISSSSKMDALAYLAGLTGTKTIGGERDFVRTGCAVHCKEQHVHVRSQNRTWTVTGAKATILLVNIRPYLVLKGAEADNAIAVGLKAPFKPATPKKMVLLGWALPVDWS